MNNKTSFAGSNASWLVYGLAALTIATGAFVGMTITSLTRNAADERVWMSLSTSVQVESQKLAKSAVESALGNLNAFNDLEGTHRLINADMQILRAGDPTADLPAAPSEVSGEMSALNATWNTFSANAKTIISSEALVNELSESSTAYLTIIPNMQRMANQVLNDLVESGAPTSQIVITGRMVFLFERMNRRVSDILQNKGDLAEVAQALREETQAVEQYELGLRRGSSSLGVNQIVNQRALASLAQVRQLLEEAKPQLEIVLEASVNLADVRQAADSIFLDSDKMFLQAGNLTEAVAALPRARAWPSTGASTLGLIALIVLLGALVGIVIVGARRRADTAFRSNKRTQQAIVRLLDELSCLADGDLTARATVTDEVTGAIADAVNFAVEQLRELVVGINNTASAVATSAENTRNTTSLLAQSANEQAGQVARATEKIQAMSSAFGTMAERSKESSETAMESVSIAHTGAEKVRETIEGMGTIREQIQETSKRIKRLGESTQEIGDIVSLINDIAEQTNVLALNAAIQAASAGGSGQGFAVVADEVQQLAESATNATKRISGLVQTIQVDTAEAIKSMESTTSEVVAGARLAQDAGVALVQTEKASTELANLVQDISNEAQTHSEQAGRISELMDGIRNVSIRTSEGTSVTATSVAELAELVLKLQGSVADFKLPSDERADLAEPDTAMLPDDDVDFDDDLADDPNTGSDTRPAFEPAEDEPASLRPPETKPEHDPEVDSAQERRS